ncbi:MAG TPA: SDR family NAD(P)-dependent oxidoreductase [Candidatus Sulfopaludibacter sp.]|nr:SDR family NAD(P)-dependent oxidoreductase [Candidatus Sulfopaludibacter sp.]
MSQIVLITGAKGGLGAHVTRAFLGAGAKVVGSARSIRDSEFDHPHFAGIPADLTKPEDAGRLVAAAIERFGAPDVLVHVAGGFAYGGGIHETGDAIWEQMMDLNARAAFYVLRAVLPHLRERHAGRIVAIGSRAGVEPAANVAAYAASKAALVSLVRTAALENRDFGITANVILPGTIDTEANRRADPNADRSKWVSPERIADLALFLASDAASQITGAAIPFYGAGL